MSLIYLKTIFRITSVLVASFRSESSAARFSNVFWLRRLVTLNIAWSFFEASMPSIFLSISSLFGLICLSLMFCSISVLSVFNVDF